VPKKAQITQERVEYNVFLFGEPPKGSKSLKISKISLTFRFDKLSNLSKSIHTGENSQILTVSNKKHISITTVVLDHGEISHFRCSIWIEFGILVENKLTSFVHVAQTFK
jgi:hypothetical protein